jgi:pimeloyl-ACP methyl ester carboxylesterase
MAEDAAAVLDALQWSSAHVVGHSLGGMIAQSLAIEHPERVLSLTSISSTPGAGIGRFRLTTALRLITVNPIGFLGRPPRTAEQAGNRLLRGNRITGSPGFPTDERWLRDMATVSFERGFDPAADARQQAAAWTCGDLRPRLAGLGMPTLVLHGSCDVLVRPAGGIATAAAIPGARLELIAGMGHDLPREVWPLIADMIRAVAEKARYGDHHP